MRVHEVTTLSGYLLSTEKIVHFDGHLRDTLCTWGNLEPSYHCYTLDVHFILSRICSEACGI
jgi:hypothetical protein